MDSLLIGDTENFLSFFFVVVIFNLGNNQDDATGSECCDYSLLLL